MIAEAALALTVATATATASPAVPPPVAVAPQHPGQNGRRHSTYVGRFFIKAWEPFRQCVAQREGRFQYGAIGRHGTTYYGTYQLTGPLAVGAAWEMAPELRDMFGDRIGKRIARQLRETPANRWHRFYQDMAFWTVLNVHGRGEGLPHWAGGRFTCTPGMPHYGGNR